jgi:3-oxoacyl-[acyl-carrier-protein] synthase II
VGGLDAVLSADRAMIGEGRLPRPYINPNACINMVTGKVSMLIGATGPAISTITACATGSTSLAIGAMLIQAGMAKVAICGGVDFPLVEPIVAGFATMNGAYRTDPDRLEPPGRASRPFSADRRGFVVSEGAGAIILASREFAETHGLDFRVELAGWLMNSDAHHYVAPHLPTVMRCISGALDHAHVKPRHIQAINAHAASTKIGDQVEADAIRTVFGSHIPPITANKSLLGHTMGGSSAIECILAIHGLLNNQLPPTINHQPDPGIGMDSIVDTATNINQECVLKNAFGFGGMNCCLVFRKT